MISLLVWLTALGILLFVHELGHYLTAKALGIDARTFSLGTGPKIISKELGSIEYRLCILPFGGCVQLLKNDPKLEATFTEQGHFSWAQNVRKVVIALAGPFFSFLLGSLMFTLGFLSGVPSLTSDVGKVQENSAGERGGMKSGDRIVAIEDKPITEWGEIREALQKTGGRETHFVVEREGRKVTLRITPVLKETQNITGGTQSLWLIGALPSGNHITKHYDVLTAISMGGQRTWDMISLEVRNIWWLIFPNSDGTPVLIRVSAHEASEGPLNFVLYLAILSIKMGIVYLFPIPILDGGRILFYLIEGMIGRPLSFTTRKIAQRISLCLIASFFVFAFYNDIMRIFVKPG